MATWTCKCGQVEAEIPETGNRLVCYCNSCRAFVERLGDTDRLDAAGGSDLLQLKPQDVRFRKGTEHLHWMRLTEKGPLRWYAACCNTPMANTLGTRALPFASFQVHDITPKDSLPPVRAHVHLKGATARVENPKRGMAGLVIDLLLGVAKARLLGRWRDNPFFDVQGRPIATQQDQVPGNG